jgi:hypothetical protein
LKGLNEERAGESRKIPECPEATFNRDTPCPLSISDADDPADEDMNELHGGSEHKDERIGAPILIKAFERASGLVVWKKEEDRANGKQAKGCYDGCHQIKASPAMMKR